MKRNKLIKTLSAILAVIMLSSLVVACNDDHIEEDGDPGCNRISELSELEVKRNAMNQVIMEVVCYNKAELTREQLAVCVSNFENIQTKYSKKLICEQDGKNYYYPAFVLQANYSTKDVTETTRYVISPLDVDESGVYMGVMVTAYEAEIKPPTELEQKVQEMNSKIRSFEGSGFTKEEMEKRVAEYEAFASNYRNQPFYVEDNGLEHCYPQLYYNIHCNNFDNPQQYYDPKTTRFRITHNRYAMNKDGIYTGLTVYLYEIDPEELELGLM